MSASAAKAMNRNNRTFGVKNPVTCSIFSLMPSGGRSSS